MRHRRWFLYQFVAILVTSALWVIGCQAQPPSSSPNAASSPAATTVLLNGTGATFPLFLYQRWFSEYSKQHPEVQINYQPTGSAVGIQQVISETIDFGGSDVPLTDEEIAQVERGVVMLPVTAGSVAVAYNLPGIESGLRLSRQALVDIFLGKITQWNDSTLTAANPDITLPDLPITVVYRSDGSGTTAAFTNHLNAISPEWQQQMGTGLNVEWKTGVGIKSNAGVSAQIQQAQGTIGYVEYSYAKQLQMAIAALENKAGNSVLPTPASMAAVINSVALPDDLRVIIPDPDGAEAYPIVTYSWLLAYKTYDDPNKANVLRDVMQWGLTEGQAFSEELGYVPLPSQVTEQVAAAIQQIKS
ncbi:MAG: phosphate ABC transporter substrate-binding protein PstS [Leptolyngbyaceae cyanobacterium SL_7_1]|nr:phosphate ABC transporter substrate-binding protein PstS [Leptolyngbyaceae cyanobacterium SL_7_1]